MKWNVLLRKNGTALLQSKNDKQYVVVSGYDETQPEGQQWNHGTYFTYWEDGNKKADCLQEALDTFRYRTEENYVTKGQKYLEVYREDYTESTFKEILQSLDLDDYQVGDAFGVFCIVDEKSLKSENNNSSTISRDRLIELSTKFKDRIAEDAMDFALSDEEFLEYFTDECEMTDDELDFFKIPRESDGDEDENICVIER